MFCVNITSGIRSEPGYSCVYKDSQAKFAKNRFRDLRIQIKMQTNVRLDLFFQDLFCRLPFFSHFVWFIERIGTI